MAKGSIKLGRGQGHRADLRWMCIGIGGSLAVFGSLLHLINFFTHTQTSFFTFVASRVIIEFGLRGQGLGLGRYHMRF